MGYRLIGVMVLRVQESQKDRKTSYVTANKQSMEGGQGIYLDGLDFVSPRAIELISLCILGVCDTTPNFWTTWEEGSFEASFENLLFSAGPSYTCIQLSFASRSALHQAFISFELPIVGIRDE